MIEKEKPNYRIIGINLLIMVAYTVLLRLTGKDDLGLYICAFAIAAQVVVCFILCLVTYFINQFKKNAGMWLLSSLAVLLVGFGTCMGVFFIH